MSPNEPNEPDQPGITDPVKPGEIDPAIQEATNDATAPDPDDLLALDPHRKQRDALLADPSSPYYALYAQALKNLELLGPEHFKNRRQREQIALAIALQAAAIGLSRVDRVALSDDRAGYFFVDDRAVDPAMRGYIAHAEAMKPGLEAKVPELQRLQEQRVGQEQQLQTEQVQQQTQQRGQQDHQRREAGDRRQDVQRSDAQQRSDQQDRNAQQRSDQQRDDQQRQAQRDERARQQPAAPVRSRL